MIGVKDEVLHLILISHFLLLFIFMILVLLLAMYFCVKIPGSL